MNSLEKELQRLTDVVKTTALTPIDLMPEDVREEISALDRKVLKALAEIMISCKEADDLLAKKQRLLNSVAISKDCLSSF